MKIKPLTFALGLALSSTVQAFTQFGGQGIMPMGHEWLTRTAALEVLDAEHIIEPDPNDPRHAWRYGLAKNIALHTAQDEITRLQSQLNNNPLYEPRYDSVNSAIVGERWVDIAGFNVTNASTDPTGPNCFSAVSQEPADIQLDHFMRRYDDIAGQGGVDAAYRAQQRFVQHFIDAAMAEEKRLKVWDGGGHAALAEVDHNYFLFGRAVHLFQDSFSPEHTVRLPQDNYEKVWQVKAYLCSEGAEQHSHDTKDVLNFTSGDVIWQANTRLESGWQSYRISSMKPVAIVALEASKDLWAAFIRTMATPKAQRRSVAEQEAQQLVQNWLSFDEAAMLAWYEDESKRDHTYVLAPNEPGKGKSLEACMAELNVGTTSQAERVAQLDAERNQCLFNIEAEPGFEDLNDPHLDIPYNWRWKSLTWQTPPSGWTYPQLSADTGTQITIKSSVNNQYLAAQTLSNNTRITFSPTKPLDLIQVTNTEGQHYFRATHAPSLFLSYSSKSAGYLKLVDSPKQALYSLIYQGGVWNIKNQFWQQYIWFNQAQNQPELNRHGEPDQLSAKWMIEPF
ncbi:hemolysin D [Pseudoalteromonas sp. OF7H-1]|uniref:hemolysin D n=1 Tax=Pseudoalteromonas sp. OF7H-1 TaxID=2917755 RepID=UPI001EF4109D|nr:hemolysin D [Pseudoalteromonas sp. OF7H-1]MCG7540690.1 hemolysin D [Pseudoalteromonas sp. OF7H-1]